jgi:hypothetical protein
MIVDYWADQEEAPNGEAPPIKYGVGGRIPFDHSKLFFNNLEITQIVRYKVLGADSFFEILICFFHMLRLIFCTL